MGKVDLDNILEKINNSVTIENGIAIINNRTDLQANIHKLSEIASLEKGVLQAEAQYVTRLIALAFGAIPASIHELYLARGRGEIPNSFTVPAINLRMLSFDSARSVFRAAKRIDAGAFIIEIARSEMGYSDQRPTEYVTNILAAAIAEDYIGPIFIQGDHFQVSAKRYAGDPNKELQGVKDLTKEAINAGFYNIDIDTSTLVDIQKLTVAEQQEQNADLSAMFTGYIRELEPKGITISVGGEIGEVGGHNSNEVELRAYMDAYLKNIKKISSDTQGLSKISIQTGTSHGGVVLPDGSIAMVNVDFDTLLNLSRVARNSYQMGGAVQHGASTLPEDAFGKFVESEALEVHLATNFQNIIYDHLPSELRDEMYAHISRNHASERKQDMTDEQFYYKTRKYAIGPFKKDTWHLSENYRDDISRILEGQFDKLFKLLCIGGTRQFVENTVHPIKIQPNRKFYLGDESAQEDVSDLAD
jgi:fructose/tagatose bisphosphate aldolase